MAMQRGPLLVLRTLTRSLATCSTRSIFTSSAAREAARYGGALPLELLQLINACIEAPPPPLATALPLAPLTLLRHPANGNQVLLMGDTQTSRARTAREAGALVQQLQPGLLALQSLRGFDSCLVGRIDMRQERRPPHVGEHFWQMGQHLLLRKSKTLAQLQECRELLDEVLAPEVRQRLARLQRLCERELQSPLLQDDIVDLAQRTVHITQAIRLTGGFDQPLLPKRSPGLAGTMASAILAAADLLRRLPFLLTGRGQYYEMGAAYRVALMEAPADARVVCLMPPRSQVVDWVKRKDIQGFKAPTSTDRARAELRSLQILQKGELVERVPEGLHASLLDDKSRKAWEERMAWLQAWQANMPMQALLDSWFAAYMGEALWREEPPPNRLTLAVVDVTLLPLVVKWWLDKPTAAALEEAAAPSEAAAETQQPQQQKRRGRRKRR